MRLHRRIASPCFIRLSLLVCTPLALLSVMFAVPAHAQRDARRIELMDNLEKGWAEHWSHRDLRRKQTSYRVVRFEGRVALLGESVGSASGLWRTVTAPPFSHGTISWSWSIARSLVDNTRERAKRGDDFAARVFVVFGNGRVNWTSRALCYVWAGNEPVESIYRSPYVREVAMVVVESGDTNAGRWMSVERDLAADYRRAFGERPDRVAAVALMVDTDDTRSRARAYFADLALEF